MTTSAHFRTSAQNLAEAATRAGINLDVYQLLALTDQLVTHALNFGEPVVIDPATHEGRILTALNSPLVMEYMREKRKILAIKELRRIASCGLKEAKDAVESDSVHAAAGLPLHRPD